MSLIQDVESVCLTLFPKSRVQEFLPYFEETFQYGGITTALRAAMFVGQVGVECEGFQTFSEKLGYSAQRLTEVWPSRFRFARPGEEAMEIFADKKRNPTFYDYDPVKLANFVYGSREGNRSEKYGDGYRFRGRGPKQITFANNYLAFTKDMVGILDIDFIKNPDALLVPRNGMYGATWFWKVNRLSIPTDRNKKTSVKEVTLIVNNGLNKLAERTKIFNKTLSLLS